MAPIYSSLQRAAADECLRTVFGDAYGALPLPRLSSREPNLDSLLIADVLGLADEGVDTFEAARRLQARIAPASLESYARTLAAGAERRG
jgi:hypothetical protein